MILINDVKYACMECIRGHRSSMCRHHERPLLQVRSKGRPNVGNGNKNHRIAVFAEEVASSPEPEEGESCKDFPVVILKASDKQIIDLLNGQILGPYCENQNKLYNQRPVISSDSFINSSVCCSKGASKVTKLCCCNKGNVSKSKILKSYLDRRIQKKGTVKSEPQVNPAKLSCCSSKKKIENNKSFTNGETANAFANSNQQWTQVPQVPPPVQNAAYPQTMMSNGGMNNQLPTNPLLQFQTTTSIDYSSNKVHPDLYQNLASSNTGGVFEVVNIPSCSIQGTCRCTSDCNCPGCVEHNNAPKSSIQLDTFRNDAQYGSNLFLTLRDQPQPTKPILDKQPPASHPVSFPKDFDTYANFFRLLLGENPENQDPSSTEPLGDVCECPDDACFCTNCEVHGIIDGYKLDDLFASRALAETNGFKTEASGSLQDTNGATH